MDDPILLTFARQFCKNLRSHALSEMKAHVWGGGACGGPLGGIPSHMERWCARVLYECVACDKSALFFYMQLHHAALTYHWTTQSNHAWSLRATLKSLCLSSFLENPCLSSSYGDTNESLAK